MPDANDKTTERLQRFERWLRGETSESMQATKVVVNADGSMTPIIRPLCHHGTDEALCGECAAEDDEFFANGDY